MLGVGCSVLDVWTAPAVPSWFVAAAIALAVVFPTNGFAQAEVRNPIVGWTTTDGHVYEGQFVKLQGTVLLVARDRFQFTIPVAALTPPSLYLAKRLALRGSLPVPASSTVPAVPVMRAIPVTRIPRALPAPQPPPVASFDFGPTILAYCRENVGRKIGTGQCASLASSALRNAGAAVRAGPDWPGDGDYVWGDAVAFVKVGLTGLKGVKDLAHVRAGDIVQFHDAEFSGFDHAQEGVYRLEAAHHTAVLESVDLRRRTITVLHQNWNGHQSVRRQTLYLGGMTHGWLRFYRPMVVPQAIPAAAVTRFLHKLV
jgi:hypothetical protein